ncbi:MAG: transcription termination factor NusA [Clostridia bacterium]
MNKEFIKAIRDLSENKGIDAEILYEAVKTALAKSYTERHGNEADIDIQINVDNGEVKAFRRYIVVDEVEDSEKEMSLEKAKEIRKEAKIGDVINVDITTKDFARKSARAAKQMVVQKIREAEKTAIFDKFIDKTDDIITETLYRTDGRNFYVDLGNTEAILPQTEQIENEHYRVNKRMKFYIAEVKKSNKEPQIVISRTHPGLIKRLFELEVPEVFNGIVEIKSIAREAGSRTKISVHSSDENVDPVGACVGPRGTRVQAIVNELNGEKIDVVEWDESPEKYVKNALCPSQVLNVVIEEEDERKANVVVPDNQLSLAIGKDGQNARLAARLTSWKIDIKSASQAGFSNEEDTSER